MICCKFSTTSSEIHGFVHRRLTRYESPLIHQIDGSPDWDQKGTQCGRAIAQRCGCPRNCKRRIFRHRATGISGPGKAAEGDDPRARRPAVSSGHARARRSGCTDGSRTEVPPGIDGETAFAVTCHKACHPRCLRVFHRYYAQQARLAPRRASQFLRQYSAAWRSTIAMAQFDDRGDLPGLRRRTGICASRSCAHSAGNPRNDTAAGSARHPTA
jgi:hypothetical protein